MCGIMCALSKSQGTVHQCLRVIPVNKTAVLKGTRQLRIKGYSG